MIVSMEALGNILALADDQNSSDTPANLLYNDALIVPVWISIFCKRFINFQRIFFQRPPVEIGRPYQVARLHMAARLFIDRFSINQIKILVWVMQKEHMCQNMTRASSKKHHVFSSPRQKYVTRPLGCAHIFQCGFEYVLVIFSQKYSLSDRVILGVVGQPNFFVVKKSTLNGGRLLIISWQPMVDEIGTLACTYLK
jgi:hypothetical protein